MTPKDIAVFAAEVYGELRKANVDVPGFTSSRFTEQEAWELTKITVKAKVENSFPFMPPPED